MHRGLPRCKLQPVQASFALGVVLYLGRTGRALEHTVGTGAPSMDMVMARSGTCASVPRDVGAGGGAGENEKGSMEHRRIITDVASPDDRQNKNLPITCVLGIL